MDFIIGLLALAFVAFILVAYVWAHVYLFRLQKKDRHLATFLWLLFSFFSFVAVCAFTYNLFRLLFVNDKPNE